MQSRISNIRTPIFAAFAVASVFTTYIATAEEKPGTIVVEAVRPSRSGTTGAPIKTVSTHRVVSYSDISLTTASGIKVLETRIRDAATAACGELELKYPVPAEGDSTAKCVANATEPAMAEAHRRIDAARMAANKK